MLKSQNKQKNQNLKNLHNGVRFISKCSVHLLLCALLVMYMVVPVSATEVSQTEPLRFTKSVNALTAGKTYQFRVNTTDSVKWSVGNEKIAVVNKNGSTMIPLRFVSEAFGADVNWDNNTNTVIINL